MKIFDTQSQKLKEFITLEPDKVKMYVCGPTVYDSPHLGHARCYITWDMVYKYLKFKGYSVTYVRNITDVDDKIINKAKETGQTTEEIAKKYYAEFEKAMAALNVEKPNLEPKATETIGEMIAIVEQLIDKGYAYEVNGDVYFDVQTFPKYGRLSRQNVEDLKAGARVETSGIKKNPADFALWKAVEQKEEISWDSPWGKGRPGWHLECSAMSRKYLGETLDIHAGGYDLIFPHHENEKAQSEACFEKDFVQFWMHNGFVRINQEKMSKSLGNFITIEHLLERYDSNTIRFFILTNHYRVPVEFTDEALNAAKNGVQRLKNAYQDIKAELGLEKINEAYGLIEPLLDEILRTGKLPFHDIDKMRGLEEKIPADVLDSLIKNLKSFTGAMDDDFNTPRALSVLFDIANCAQKHKCSELAVCAVFCIALLLKFSEVLGFDLTKAEKASDKLTDQLMDLIIGVRQMAREEKNWVMSDKIRDELAEIGITLKDQKDKKTTWSFQ